MEQNTLTRRGFLKASALAGAAAALGVGSADALVEAPPAFADEEAPERTAIHTVCHGCIQACPCTAYVENGVVVKLEGDERAPVSKGSMCLKGLAQQHTAYSPLRILYPMKRTGARGAENAAWERISWDEAIQLVADQLIETVEKYGPYGIWMGTGGGGQYVSPQGQVIPKCFGAPIQISGGALQCYGPRRLASGLMLGDHMTNMSMADASLVEPFNEYSPTMETLVIWGAQPSVSQTAQSGRGMADARENRGVKTVVIDPYMTPDATKADVWLPIRPGSDTALILCFMRYVIKNDLIDERFCKYWTNMPFLINPETKLPWLAEEVWPDYENPAKDPNDHYDTPAYVCFDAITNSIQPFPYTAPEDSPVDPVIFATAEVNGLECKTGGQYQLDEAEEWTLEKTGEVCWLEPDMIEAAIKLYAEVEHAGICEGVFGDMQEVSSIVPEGLTALEMMMGHVYKPGTALTANGGAPKSRPTSNPGDHNDRWGIGWTFGLTEKANRELIEERLSVFAEEGKDPQAMAEGAFQLLKDRFGSDKYRATYFADMTHNGSIRESCLTGEPYRMRVLLEVSGNKLVTLANTSSWHEAYDNLDFIVQQYTNFTSFTVEHADLVLPIQEWLEYNSGENLWFQDNYNFFRRQIIHMGETVAPERPYMAALERVHEMKGDDFFFDYSYLFSGNTRVLYDDIDAKKQLWAERWGAPNWDEFMENFDEYNPTMTPDEDYWVYNQHEAIVDDGLPAGFATMSRKCEVYCDQLYRIGKNGFPLMWPFEFEDVGLEYSPVCVYHEFEENGLQDDPDYPLVFTSGRVPHFHHGTLRHAAFNRELAPVADCFIHPDKAAEYGIEEGDYVKITSRRGEAVGRAHLTAGINPRVIRQERFWYPEAFDDSQAKKTGGWEYSISNLTRDDVSDAAMGSATYRGFNVQIEKVDKPDNIWTEPEQFAPFLPTLQNEPMTDEVVF